MAGFSVVGLTPLWPVLFLGVLFGAIVRLEAKMTFQRLDELARAVGSAEGLARCARLDPLWGCES